MNRENNDCSDPEYLMQFWNKVIPAEAARYYNLNASDFKFHSTNCNSDKYEIDSNNGGYFLRATVPEHRNPTLLEAEADWVLFLANYGLPVSKPIASQHGNYVETVSWENMTRHLMLFSKAQGDRPKEWTPRLIRDYGQLMAKMHSTSSIYKPSRTGCFRPRWLEDMTICEMEKIIGERTAIDQRIIDIFHKVKDEILGLEKTDDSYGIIHADFHARNFFVFNDKLSIFDFDDCAYSWFVNDIAISLYYSCNFPQEKADEYLFEFANAFCAGYEALRKIDCNLRKLIPVFYRLKRIIFYLQYDPCPNGVTIPVRQWWSANASKKIIDDRVVIDELFNNN
jgi:amicoumacin kinase